MAKKENINNTIYTRGEAMPGKLSGAPTIMNNGVTAEDAMGSQAVNAYGEQAVQQHVTDLGIMASAPEAVMYGQAVNQWGKQAVDDFVQKRYDYYKNLGDYYQHFIPPQSGIDWGVVRAQNLAARERFNTSGDEGVVRAAIAGEHVRRLVEQGQDIKDKAFNDKLTLVARLLNMSEDSVSQAFTPEELNMYALYDYFERNMQDEALPVNFLRSEAVQGLTPEQFTIMKDMVIKTSPYYQQLMEKDAYDRGVDLQNKLNDDTYNIFYRFDKKGNYIEPTDKEARQVSDNQFIAQHVSETTSGFWDTTKFMIGSLVSLVSDTQGQKKFRDINVSPDEKAVDKWATDFLAGNYPKSTENTPLPSSMMGLVGSRTFQDVAFAPQQQAMQMLAGMDDLQVLGLLWSVPTDQAFMAELAHDVAKNPQVKWSQVLKQTADARALVTALTMFADIGTMALGLAGKTVSGSIGKAFLRKTLGDYMTSGARRGAERFLTSTAGRSMVDFAGGAMDAALIMQGAQGATGYSSAGARMELMGAEDQRMEAFFQGITTNFLTNLGIGAVFNSPSLIPVGVSMIANMYHGMRDATIVANKLNFTADGRKLSTANESLAARVDRTWKMTHPNEDGNLYIWSGDLSKVLRAAEEQGVPLTPQQRRYILEPDFERVADLYDDVSITLGDFTAHFEGTPLGELMKEHLRGTPTSRSRAQFLADQQEYQRILNRTLNNEAAAKEFVRLAGMAPSRGLRRMLERSAIRAGYLEETFPHIIGDVKAFTRLTGRYEELFPSHPAYKDNWLKGEQDAVLADAQAAEASRARTASLSEQTRLASFDSRDMPTPEWTASVAQSQAATQGAVARIESERAATARASASRLSEQTRLANYDSRDMLPSVDVVPSYVRATQAQVNPLFESFLQRPSRSTEGVAQHLAETYVQGPTKVAIKSEAVSSPSSEMIAQSQQIRDDTAMVIHELLKATREDTWGQAYLNQRPANEELIKAGEHPPVVVEPVAPAVVAQKRTELLQSSVRMIGQTNDKFKDILERPAYNDEAAQAAIRQRSVDRVHDTLEQSKDFVANNYVPSNEFGVNEYRAPNKAIVIKAISDTQAATELFNRMLQENPQWQRASNIPVEQAVTDMENIMAQSPKLVEYTRRFLEEHPEVKTAFNEPQNYTPEERARDQISAITTEGEERRKQYAQLMEEHPEISKAWNEFKEKHHAEAITFSAREIVRLLNETRRSALYLEDLFEKHPQLAYVANVRRPIRKSKKEPAGYGLLGPVQGEQLHAISQAQTSEWRKAQESIAKGDTTGYDFEDPSALMDSVYYNSKAVRDALQKDPTLLTSANDNISDLALHKLKQSFKNKEARRQWQQEILLENLHMQKLLSDQIKFAQEHALDLDFPANDAGGATILQDASLLPDRPANEFGMDLSTTVRDSVPPSANDSIPDLQMLPHDASELPVTRTARGVGANEATSIDFTTSGGREQGIGANEPGDVAFHTSYTKAGAVPTNDPANLDFITWKNVANTTALNEQVLNPRDALAYLKESYKQFQKAFITYEGYESIVDSALAQTDEARALMKQAAIAETPSGPSFSEVMEGYLQNVKANEVITNELASNELIFKEDDFNAEVGRALLMDSDFRPQLNAGPNVYTVAAEVQAKKQLTLASYHQARVSALESELEVSEEVASKLEAAYRSRMEKPLDNVDVLDPVRDAKLARDLKTELETERLAAQNQNTGVAQDGNVEQQNLVRNFTQGLEANNKFKAARAELEAMREGMVTNPVKYTKIKPVSDVVLTNSEGIHTLWSQKMRQNVADILALEQQGAWRGADEVTDIIVKQMMLSFNSTLRDLDAVATMWRNDSLDLLNAFALREVGNSSRNVSMQVVALVSEFNATLDNVVRFSMNKDIDGMLSSLLVSNPKDAARQFGLIIRTDPELDSVSKGSLYGMLLRTHRGELNPIAAGEEEVGTLNLLSSSAQPKVPLDTLIKTMARVLSPSQLQMLAMAANFRALERSLVLTTDSALRSTHGMNAFLLATMANAIEQNKPTPLGYRAAQLSVEQAAALDYAQKMGQSYQTIRQAVQETMVIDDHVLMPDVDAVIERQAVEHTPEVVQEEAPAPVTEPVLDQEVKADINPELPKAPDEVAPSNIDAEQPPMHSLGYRDNETVQVPEPQYQYDRERHDFVSVRAPMSQRSAQGQGSKRGTVQPDYAAMNQRIQTASVKREPFEEFRNNLYAEMMVQGVNLERSQANHVLNHTAQIFDSMAESLGMSIDDFMGNGKFNVSFKFVDNPRDFRMKQAGSDVISQGEFDPKTFTIYLKQDPNILEFTHEMAHYWTQMYFQAPLEAHIKAKADPQALSRMLQEQKDILEELGYEGKTWNQLSGLDKNRVQERVVKGYLNTHAMESATVMDTDHMNMLTNYAQFDRAMARGAVDAWNTREVGDTWENAVIKAVAKDTDEFQKLYGDYLGEVKGDKKKFFGSDIYNSVMNHYAFDNELARYNHTVQGYSKLNIEDVAYLKENVEPMMGTELKNREAYLSTLENFDQILGALESEGYMGKMLAIYNKIQDANKFFKSMADNDVEVMAQRANIAHIEREVDRIRGEIANAKKAKLDTKALQDALKVAKQELSAAKAQLKAALAQVKKDMSRIKKTMDHWKTEYETELTNARVLFHNEDSVEYRRWHANDLLVKNMKQFGQKLSLQSLENERIPRYITTELVDRGLAGVDGNMTFAEFTKAYVDGRDMKLGVAKLRELSEHRDLEETITRYAQRKIEMKKNSEEVMANLMSYITNYEVGKLQKALKIRAAPDDPTDFRSLITQVSRSVSNDVGNIKYNELTPRKFLFKATFARRQAFEALKKRDTKAAFMAMLSSATFIERAKRAGQVKAELDKQIKTVRETFNGRRASLAETYDADTMAQGIVLLNAIGLTRRNDIAARRIELQRYNPEATAALERRLNEFRAQNQIYYYTEMPSGDLRAILDAAKHIADEAKMIKQEGDTVAAEMRHAYRKEVTDTIEAENKGKFDVKDKSYLGDTKNTRSTFSRVVDAMKQSRFRSWPMESILEYIEAATDGPLKRHVFNPVKQAEDLYHQDLTAQAKALRSVGDRLDKLDDELKKSRGKATVSIEGSTYNGKRERVPHTWELGTTGRLRYDLFGVMLNMGNESNVKRVAASLGVTERDLHNFIHDWQAQGYITDVMWDLAQEVWDLFDKVDLKNQKVYYNINGHYYEYIQPKRFISYSGKEYKGGYVPLTVLHDEPIKLDINNVQGYLREGFPNDPKFAKGRVEHDYLLDLSFVAVAQGMQRELAFGHMMEPVLKAHRLLENPQVKSMLDSLSPDLSQMLTDWLVDMANGRPTAMMNMSEAQKLANMACTNVTTSMMMGNVVNAAMTIANFAPAMTRVRPAYLLKSVAGVAKTDWIAKQSVFMANRWAAMGSSMDTTISRLKSRSPLSRASKWLGDHAYVLQIYTQRYMDAWVWDGAFNDFIAQNPKDYTGAVAHADQVVRTTQGSFELSGRSASSRDSALVAALTPFTGYFNTMEALMRSTNRMWNKHETSRLRMAMNMALSASLVTVVPALISQAILSQFSGDVTNDRKGEKSVLADLLLSPFKQYAMQYNPYVGALVNTFIARATGTTDFGIGRVPALTQLNTSVASAGKLVAAMMDDGKEIKYKDLIGALAFLSLINPVFGPLTREGKVLDPMLKGYDDSVWDMLRAVVTMRASPDMRAYADRFN